MSAPARTDAAASPGRTSGPAAGARGAHRGPAPGSDAEKKRVVAFGAAARLCGSDKVSMTPDGVFEMSFRHSKEQPLELVERGHRAGGVVGAVDPQQPRPPEHVLGKRPGPEDVWHHPERSLVASASGNYLFIFPDWSLVAKRNLFFIYWL